VNNSLQNNSLQWMAALYSALIRLYPREFRLEFEDELHSVFMALAQDAASAGALALTVFCLRELRDFPINLIRTHLEKNPMSRILDSESVHFMLRGVLAFMALLMTHAICTFLIMKQMTAGAVTFHTTGYFFNDGDGYNQALVMVFSWIIASVIAGTISAFIFGERSRLRWPVVLGIVASLPWSLPYGILQLNSLLNPGQLQMSMANLGQNSMTIAALLLLASVCGILTVALSKEQPRFRWFVLAGMFLSFPALLTSEIYHFTLIKTDALANTLGMLESLAVGAFLAGMLGLLLKDWRRMLGLIAAGMMLYPFAKYVSQQIYGWFLAPLFPVAFPVAMNGFTDQQVVLGSVISYVMIGLLFGLPLALIFIWLKKGKLPALPGQKQPVSA